MKRYLLSENGIFYKANLHSHSNWSDGRLSPKEMKDAYIPSFDTYVNLPVYDAPISAD